MIRKTTSALLVAVVAGFISRREQIWDYIKPWPKWWKLLLYLVAGLFVSLVAIWAIGQEWIIYKLIGYNQ